MRVFLAVFAKLRKMTISFVVSAYLSVELSVCPPVRPSVCMSAWNNAAPNGQIFVKFDISVFFENMSRKVNIH